MNVDVRQVIGDIFNTCQLTTANHELCLQKLQTLYNQVNHEDFVNNFLTIIGTILQQDFKTENPYVEKAIKFLTAFCTSMEPDSSHDDNDISLYESELLEDIFYYLLETQDVHNDIVRARSCQLINQIMNRLVGNDLSTDLLDYVQECMLSRLEDSKMIVRVQAAASLYRLQDPEDPDDPIIQAYINHMMDINAKVRRASIEYVALTRKVVPHLLQRTRDVEMNVRLAAFKKASARPNYFKISEKQELIVNGFRDSSPAIQKFVEKKLLNEWLEHYNNDYIELLHCLFMDCSEEDIEKSVVALNYVLGALFATRPHSELIAVLEFNSDRVIPYENLRHEEIIFWYYLVQYLRKDDQYESVLETVLPEIVYFCQYVVGFYKLELPEDNYEKYLKQQFVLKYMFLILKGYDFSDVGTSNCLNTFIAQTLKNAVLAIDVVKTLRSCLEISMPNITQQISFLCELIADILHPLIDQGENQKYMEIKMDLAKNFVKLDCLKENQLIAVKEKDYIKAADYQKDMTIVDEEIKILKEKQKTLFMEEEPNLEKIDVLVLKRCLDIADAVLLCPTLKSLCPALKALKATLVEPLLTHKDTEVRCKALKCYTHCCLLNRKTAEMGIHILAANIEMYMTNVSCDTETLLVAIRGVTDMIVIYGTSLVVSPEDHGESDSMHEQNLCVFKCTSLSSVVQGLVDMMDEQRADIQECAVRALFNLIFTGRVHSSSLISRMILRWSIPIAESDDDLQKQRQIIGILLERLPSIPNTAEQMEQAVLPTIRIISQSPQNSPLSEVNLDNIVKFMLGLCKQYSSNFVNLHYNLALTIHQEMESHPNSKVNLAYSKALHFLELPVEDSIIINELIRLYDELRNYISERSTLNNLTRFLAFLDRYKEQSAVVAMEE